jgi:hypothetical protein
MNVFIQEIMFLATSVRVWLLLVLALMVIGRRRLRNANNPDAVFTKSSFDRPIKILIWANVIILVANLNACFFAGPIRGRILDAQSGKPVVGAVVSAGCSHENPPIRMPWYFELMRQRGRGAGRSTKTDLNGNFHVSWYGYEAWKAACTKNTVEFYADNYTPHSLPYSNGKLVVGWPTRAFVELEIELSPKAQTK